MKSRICVRSMVLGAVIMLIGLAVGAIVSPPLVAQRNGVFDDIVCSKLTVVDKIVCREIEVVDQDGTPAIVLEAEEWGNEISVLGLTQFL